MQYLFLILILSVAAGCSDAVVAPDGGMTFGEVDGTIRGSPYEAGHPDAGDAAGASEAGLDGDATRDGAFDGAADDDAALDAAKADGSDAGGDAGPKPCPPDLFLSSRSAGDLKAGQPASGEIKYDCDAARYAVILPKGMTIRLTLQGANLTPALHLYGPGTRGLIKEDSAPAIGGTLSVEFTADMAGEYFAIVDQAGRHGTAQFTVGYECLDHCDLHATRYPIVLVHGFSGFHNIGPIDYFYKVVDTIAPLGYDLHIAVLDAYNSTEKRGPELAAYVDQVLADTFADKVNIVAHSQGGVDARYIISGMSYGDRVGSLNMVATPHHGTQLADVILDDPTGLGKPILDAMLTLMGAVLDGPQAEQNAHDCFVTLSTKYMDETFNPTYLDDPRVRYKSWAGRTCEVWESNCPNPVNAYLVVTYELLKSKAGGGISRGSSTRTTSTRWGSWPA